MLTCLSLACLLIMSQGTVQCTIVFKETPYIPSVDKKYSIWKTGSVNLTHKVNLQESSHCIQTEAATNNIVISDILY